MYIVLCGPLNHHLCDLSFTWHLIEELVLCLWGSSHLQSFEKFVYAKMHKSHWLWLEWFAGESVGCERTFQGVWDLSAWHSDWQFLQVSSSWVSALGRSWHFTLNNSQATSARVLPKWSICSAPHPLLWAAVPTCGSGACTACLQPLSAPGSHALGDLWGCQNSPHTPLICMKNGQLFVLSFLSCHSIQWSPGRLMCFFHHACPMLVICHFKRLAINWLHEYS